MQLRTVEQVVRTLPQIEEQIIEGIKEIPQGRFREQSVKQIETAAPAPVVEDVAPAPVES